MNNLQILIPIVAYVACACCIAYHVTVRVKKTHELGDCLLVLTRNKKKIVSYIVIALSMCVIALLFFRSFDWWISSVLAATGVLGVELSLRDSFLQSRSGVYENAVITCGKMLKKEDIIAFPTLSYEKDSEDGTSVPPEMLKTVTNSSGVLFLEFVSKSERDSAAEILKNWVK